jgi:hypothetical protein
VSVGHRASQSLYPWYALTHTHVYTYIHTYIRMQHTDTHTHMHRHRSTALRVRTSANEAGGFQRDAALGVVNAVRFCDLPGPPGPCRCVPLWPRLAQTLLPPPHAKHTHTHTHTYIHTHEQTQMDDRVRHTQREREREGAVLCV